MIHITGCEHIVTGGGGWQRHVRLGTAAVGSVYPPSFTHPRGEPTKSIHTARSKHLLLDLDFFLVRGSSLGPRFSLVRYPLGAFAGQGVDDG